MMIRRAFQSVLVGLVLLAGASLAAAQDGPFAPGWTLEPEASSLQFTSVKKGSIVETSEFATFSGFIDPSGRAEVRVLLDSVDTKVDLRNVRMRFLFFETFRFPEATISLQLTEDMVADLPDVRRKVMTLPYTLALHGIEKHGEAEVAVALLAEDMVSVSSASPVMLPLADFDLETGRGKLEEAANVTIVPSTTVTFDLLFRRIADGSGAEVARVAEPVAPQSVALESQGDFSQEECVGRFEVLSRTGNIYFSIASARLGAESRPVLDSIAGIISRCPDMVVEVSGHTDSDGSDATNQRLSEARARAVAEYLSTKDVRPENLRVVGYGELRPLLPNTGPQNKARNRRIEFALAE